MKTFSVTSKVKLVYCEILDIEKLICYLFYFLNASKFLRQFLIVNYYGFYIIIKHN